MDALYLDDQSAGFQSTPSAWRVTTPWVCGTSRNGISIHTLRMEGDGHEPHQFPEAGISIHTLRMEGDLRHLGR